LRIYLFIVVFDCSLRDVCNKVDVHVIRCIYKNPEIPKVETW